MLDMVKYAKITSGIFPLPNVLHADEHVFTQTIENHIKKEQLLIFPQVKSK